MKLLRAIFNFFRDILQSRKIILDLAKRDLKTRYLGSYLGILWAFILPAINILLFWFVFQVGFKSTPVDNFPFILWLLPGMIPWNFFSDSLMGATNSILDNSYLVKKVVFRVSILPLVRVLSALFVHLFFIAFLFLVFFIYGYKPSIYNLQVFYYLFATVSLALGLSWITSSLIIFFKDLGQLVSMMLQIGFWLTPIFWTTKIIPVEYHFVLKLNPFYYIVEGYRDTFIYHIWFWEHYKLTLNFWGITLTSLLIGVFLFKKLRPHFADVL